MTRVVLVGWPDRGWCPLRQEQWMAEVRRDPGAATLPRAFFDIAEDAYRAALGSWVEGLDRDSAVGAMTRAGGSEVGPR